MFFEDFKTKYKTIPFASYSRIHKKNTCFRNKQTILHMHKEIEMLIVLSGEAKVEIAHTEYNIEKNDIVIIPPYTLHRYTLFADKDISHCCICFDAKLLYDSALVQNLEQGTLCLPFLIKNEPTLFNYIHNSYNEHIRNGDGWEFKVIGNLSLLFGDMKSAGYLYKTNTPHVTSVYSQIFNYISSNYQNNITSSDAAEFLNINNSYFCRLFKKSFGESFQNYLCQYRLEHAKRLLRFTDRQISEIALDTGFNSFSYFGKKFKAYTGVTPKQYQKFNK